VPHWLRGLLRRSRAGDTFLNRSRRTFRETPPGTTFEPVARPRRCRCQATVARQRRQRRTPTPRHRPRQRPRRIGSPSGQRLLAGLADNSSGRLLLEGCCHVDVTADGVGAARRAVGVGGRPVHRRADLWPFRETGRPRALT